MADSSITTHIKYTYEIHYCIQALFHIVHASFLFCFVAFRMCLPASSSSRCVRALFTSLHSGPHSFPQSSSSSKLHVLLHVERKRPREGSISLCHRSICSASKRIGRAVLYDFTSYATKYLLLQWKFYLRAFADVLLLYIAFASHSIHPISPNQECQWKFFTAYSSLLSIHTHTHIQFIVWNRN